MPTGPESSRLDGRVFNKGSKKRLRYTWQFKYDMTEKCDEAIHDSSQPSIKNATDYFQALYTHHDIAHKWISLYGKWNKEEHRARMVTYILGKDFASTTRQTRSPYHHMENLLYGEVLAKRNKGHRVSNTFIRLRALVLFQQLKEQEISVYAETVFKASNGWRSNFIKRRKLKYRKKKSGKKFSADKHLPQYLNFLQRLRFKLFVPLPGDTSESIWGRFPPSRRYNMDQVPLPFVVSQEFTFTLNEDCNVHITCPNEALRKRQWTMHIIVNAGKGVSRHAWVDLVTKGTGTRIKKEEKERYHPSVEMFWQKMPGLTVL